MNVPLTFTPDQQQAFNDLLAAYNATVQTPISPEDYAASIIYGPVNAQVVVNQRVALENLQDLGKRYLAAPSEVKTSVDSQLAPYS